jgi:ElaB/YqjD/DUF883 family membrane-anchored ribosome-binding protein
MKPSKMRRVMRRQSGIWSDAMGTKYGKEIAKDLEALRQDVSTLTGHLSGFLSDRGDEVAGDVKQSIQTIRDNVGEAMSQTTGKSRALVRDGVDGLGQIIEKSLHERPFMTLAIAAGLGAILTARLRR